MTAPDCFSYSAPKRINRILGPMRIRRRAHHFRAEPHPHLVGAGDVIVDGDDIHVRSVQYVHD